MTASATLAFVHHAAAFLIVAVLLVEMVLARLPLTVDSARTLLRLDGLYGLAALLILVVGFVRVYYTEKGADYYYGSGPFIAKIALFALVGLLSVYPSIQFAKWRGALRRQEIPAWDDSVRKRVRMLIHAELTLLFAMMLFAALMARGIGFVG